MIELLSTVTAPVYTYLFLLALLAADAFVPVVPTQAVMITAGALTVYGQLSLPLTIGTGALGVLVGDLCCYQLGRLRPRGDDVGHVPRHARQGRTARLAGNLRRPGPLVLLVCRFVPGGRMTACYHAGRMRYPYRLFLAYEAVAALGWAGYGGLIGHLGGSAMAGSGWRLALVATAAAGSFGLVGLGLARIGAVRLDRLAARAEAGRATSRDDTPQPGAIPDRAA